MADLVGAPPPSEPAAPREGATTSGGAWVRPPVPTRSGRVPNVRAAKIAYTVAGLIFVPILFLSPFTRMTSRRSRRAAEQSLYEQFGWPGVIGVWVFFLGLAAVSYAIYRAMRPRPSAHASADDVPRATDTPAG